MANLRALIHTERGREASRLGNRELSVRADGWDIGVRVDATYDKSSGELEFVLSLTGGSNDPLPRRTLAVVRGADADAADVTVSS